jgi:ribonuclease HI
MFLGGIQKIESDHNRNASDWQGVVVVRSARRGGTTDHADGTRISKKNKEARKGKKQENIIPCKETDFPNGHESSYNQCAGWRRRERLGDMGTITIYADGGCSGNPGPGGWAALIAAGELETAVSGNEPNTTNNRMELTAVIRALREILRRFAGQSELAIYTDSQYVKKGITEWIAQWMKNGWKNSAKDPVKNQDLWTELHGLAQKFRISWHWIKGHADNERNNRCDALVQQEIKKLTRGRHFP